MISARIEWSGDAALEGIRLLTTEAVTRATLHLWTACQLALNIPNTGERVRYKNKKTASGRKSRASRTIYPHPSKPGEPPRLRTGWLRRNVKWEVSKEGVGTVGVTQNARYGLFLELGTAKGLRPRPWLLVTVEREFHALQAIVLGAAH